MALPFAQSLNATATGCMLALSMDPTSHLLFDYHDGSVPVGKREGGPVFITPFRLGLAAAVILVNGLVSVWLRLAMHKKLAIATVRFDWKEGWCSVDPGRESGCLHGGGTD